MPVAAPPAILLVTQVINKLLLLSYKEHVVISQQWYRHAAAIPWYDCPVKVKVSPYRLCTRGEQQSAFRRWQQKLFMSCVDFQRGM